MIDQTRFLSIVFCVENIYSRVNFCGNKMFAVIFMHGNLFLRIAGKIAKIRTRKNFVPHGTFIRSATDLMFEGSIVFLISSTASDSDLNSKVLRSFSAND